MDREVLLALAHYNTYANRLVLDVAGKMTSEQLTRESQVSHSSVQKTLSHMRATGRGFLAQIQGKSVQRVELCTLDELRAGFAETDRDLEEYIRAASPAELEREVTFHLGEFQLTLLAWKALVQVFQHSIHHRGELSVLMTTLGYPLPTLDIIVQFSEDQGQPWPWK